MKKTEDLMTADWAAAFREIDPEIDAEIAKMGEFLRHEIREKHRILPAPENIFRAFSRNLAEVKVLIVGQDPYPNPDFPVGLSFSVSPKILLAKIPASLKNIFRELSDDMKENAEKLQVFAKMSLNSEVNEVKITTEFFAKNGDLTKWFEQGVMLLNRSLTVRAGEPNSHAGKGWERITEDAVKILANRDEIFAKIHEENPENFAKIAETWPEKIREKFAKKADENVRENAPLVAILWGRNARNLAPIFGGHDSETAGTTSKNLDGKSRENENILVLESAHPSPLSARNGFFGSRPFSRTNEFLIAKNAKPIDWNLG